MNILFIHATFHHVERGEVGISMKTIKFVYWQEKDFWLGYLQDYPDFMTQGETLEELQENLKDIFTEIVQGHIPLVTHVGELVVA